VIQFTVFGPPVAKGRPRLGKGHVFTPAKTRAAEMEVGLRAKVAMRGKPIITGPCMVSIVFTFQRPKSSKREHHTVKPDLDNLCKLLTDSCNGIVYQDDSQITQISISKAYGDQARTDITIRSII